MLILFPEVVLFPLFLLLLSRFSINLIDSSTAYFSMTLDMVVVRFALVFEICLMLFTIFIKYSN